MGILRGLLASVLLVPSLLRADFPPDPTEHERRIHATTVHRYLFAFQDRLAQLKRSEAGRAFAQSDEWDLELRGWMKELEERFAPYQASPVFYKKFGSNGNYWDLETPVNCGFLIAGRTPDLVP